MHRNISIPFHGITALTRTFQQRPSLLEHCKSLRLHYSDDLDVSPDAFEKTCNELGSVLRGLGERAQLEEFAWTWECRRFDDEYKVPTPVWDALKKSAPSLKRLELSFSPVECETWSAFPSPKFKNLRRLKLDFAHAHGWDCAVLDRMLPALQELRGLHLLFPVCCPAQNLSIESTYPELRAFSLASTGQSPAETSTDFVPSPTFLQRHPLLRTLFLTNRADYHLEDTDLRDLRALSIDRSAWNNNKSLFSPTARRPVAYLQLDDMMNLTTLAPFNVCTPFRETLRYLHLADFEHSLRGSTGRYCDLLRELPGLTELRIGAESGSTYPEPPPVSSDDLIAFLADLAQAPCAPSLRALSFRDTNGAALPPALLAELPPVPDTLEYLGWESKGADLLYRIERKDGKAVALEVSHRPGRGAGWLEESILDHLGDIRADEVD